MYSPISTCIHPSIRAFTHQHVYSPIKLNRGYLIKRYNGVLNSECFGHLLSRSM